MAIAFESVSDLQSGTASSTTLDFTAGGSSPGVNQCLIALFGFEGVASGSGNYISSVTQSGWHQVYSLGPSGGTGNGIEIWATNGWTSGNTAQFNFATSRTYVARGLIYGGVNYDGTRNVVEEISAANGTGNNQSVPSARAWLDEVVIGCCAQQLASPGYGTPTSLSALTPTVRIDNARAATFGNVEITAAEIGPVTDSTIPGESESFTWTDTASPAGSRWSSAQIVIHAHTPQARIYFTPATVTQTVGTTAGTVPNSTLTGHVDVDIGTGWINAANGTLINFAIQSGPGSFLGGVNTATTASGTGEGTVHTFSASTGTEIVQAETSVSVLGVLLARGTTSSTHHTTDDGVDATVTFANATTAFFYAQII